MFDIGWTELLVIGIVALIVVGPKDLPVLFRRMGEFTGKARAMAREFSRAMDEAADQAGVKEMQSTLKAAANPKQFGLDAINEAAKDLGDTSAALTDTATLSPERAEAARKIHDATAKAEQARRDEAAAAADAAGPAEAAPPPEAPASAAETTENKSA